MEKEERKYVKLSELIGSEFTVEKVWGYQFQMWDQENNKMLRSDTPEKGYRKVYQVDTDKGKLTLGSGQYSNLLEEVSKDGMADVNGKTFTVKSNGKTGQDIRYYINVFKKKDEVLEDLDDGIRLEDIPF